MATIIAAFCTTLPSTTSGLIPMPTKVHPESDAQAGEEVIQNWNHTVSFAPATRVEPPPGNWEAVQSVVRDAEKYPSPVIALGSRHTVNEGITNPGGTVIDMSAWNSILGLEDRPDELLPGQGRKVVRVQAGVKMLQMARWLDARGYECSFAPEIGDATVGSLASCTSKDSSLQAPGYFSALLASVTYVDHRGEARMRFVVTLDRAKDMQAVEDYGCSFSMKGICVELTVVVRPRCLVRTAGAAFLSDAAMPAKLLQLKEGADNIWAIVTPEHCTVEQRWRAPHARAYPQAIVEGFRWYRHRLFAKARFGMLTWGILRHLFPLSCVNYRWQMTNSYPAVTPNEDRLDFSYFEYPDINNFERTLTTLLDFVRGYQARSKTGFVLGAFVVYFVQRSGRNPQWPQLNYGGPAGWSFVCDPVYGRPEDPAWADFCTALLPVAQALGARPGGTQTKQLLARPGFFPLPRSFSPSERFLTPYFKTFLQDLQPQQAAP